MFLVILTDTDMPSTDQERELAGKVRRFIKAEAKRAGVGYKDLASRLAELGLAETEDSIASKLARGTFSAIFMISVMGALGVETLRLDDL